MDDQDREQVLMRNASAGTLRINHFHSNINYENYYCNQQRGRYLYKYWSMAPVRQYYGDILN